ncbi:hypothetical protein AAVH_38028, partial [Aphelenchoides avenae]
MAAVHELLRIFLVFVTVAALHLHEPAKPWPLIESVLQRMLLSNRGDLSKETKDAYQKVLHDLYGYHGKVRKDGFA